jgi:hypothetical protein
VIEGGGGKFGGDSHRGGGDLRRIGKMGNKRRKTVQSYDFGCDGGILFPHREGRIDQSGPCDDWRFFFLTNQPL